MLRPAAAWPPSFEVAPPIDAADAEAHPVFYEVMGRLSYDAKAKPEYRAAREAGLWIAAAQQSNLGGSDYVAAAREAAHNRKKLIASAKFTPSEIAERLDAAAAQAGRQQTGADLRLLAGLAREQAAQLRSAVDLSSGSEGVRPAPSAWTHIASGVGSFRTAADADAAYCAAESGERGAAALSAHGSGGGRRRCWSMAAKAGDSVSPFPASEITGNWDLQYFFEFLQRRRQRLV